MNRIQSIEEEQNHKIGAYEINKISLLAVMTKFIFLIMELMC